MAQEALLSLALPSRSADRPSKSRRLTSLPSVAPTIRPARRHHHHHLRFGIVPRRAGMQSGVHAGADRRQDRRLGEDLGVGADADLEILAPGALGDQHLLEPHGLGRTGLELPQVVAAQGLDFAADDGGGGRLALGALFDDALDHRNREGDAGRLDDLQVHRRQQPRPGGVAGLCDRVGEDVGETAQALAGRRPQRPGRIVGLGQIGDGGKIGGDVEHAIIADGDDGWAGAVRAPDASGQSAAAAVVGKGVCEIEHVVTCVDGRSWRPAGAIGPRVGPAYSARFAPEGSTGQPERCRTLHCNASGMAYRNVKNGDAGASAAYGRAPTLSRADFRYPIAYAMPACHGAGQLICGVWSGMMTPSKPLSFRTASRRFTSMSPSSMKTSR